MLSSSGKNCTFKYLRYLKRRKKCCSFLQTNYIYQPTFTHLRFDMNNYDGLKAEIETIQKQMVEAKKKERADAMNAVKRLDKEFSFTAVFLNRFLAEDKGNKT